MTGAPQEQPIPPDARENEEALEILRAFIVDGGLSIAFTPAFDEPGTWGVVLADLARHVSRAFERDGTCEASEALQRIVATFSAEMRRESDPGLTSMQPKQGH